MFQRIFPKVSVKPRAIRLDNGSPVATQTRTPASSSVAPSEKRTIRSRKVGVELRTVTPSAQTSAMTLLGCREAGNTKQAPFESVPSMTLLNP